jgi:hypothetical protein
MLLPLLRLLLCLAVFLITVIVLQDVQRWLGWRPGWRLGCGLGWGWWWCPLHLHFHLL